MTVVYCLSELRRWRLLMYLCRYGRPIVLSIQVLTNTCSRVSAVTQRLCQLNENETESFSVPGSHFRSKSTLIHRNAFIHFTTFSRFTVLTSFSFSLVFFLSLLSVSWLATRHWDRHCTPYIITDVTVSWSHDIIIKLPPNVNLTLTLTLLWGSFIIGLSFRLPNYHTVSYHFVLHGFADSHTS